MASACRGQVLKSALIFPFSPARVGRNRRVSVVDHGAEGSVINLTQQRPYATLVAIALASSYPLQELFALAHERLTCVLPKARLRPAAA
jgi:hypothetical protein